MGGKLGGLGLVEWEGEGPMRRAMGDGGDGIVRSDGGVFGCFGGWIDRYVFVCLM